MTFMKTFWAALLAFIVANILLVLLTFMMFAGVVAMMGDPVPVVRQGSILEIDFKQGITDSPSSSPIKSVGLSGVDFDRSNTLLQTLTAIEKASYDDNITGIYINITGGSISMANIEELRAALETFKESGKFVIGYSDVYSQMSYYFTSVADRIYLNPEGTILWKGISSNVMFYKGLLDKLGIHVEILRHGQYKAAVEPFMTDKMSAENREQTLLMLNTIWGSILQDVSLSRSIDSAVLSNYATELSVHSPKDALEYGLVDGLLYEDQVHSMLSKLSHNSMSVVDAEAELFGGEESLIVSEVVESAQDQIEEGETTEVTYSGDTEELKDPVFVSLSNYISTGAYGTANRSKNKVAVIYADGEIVDGESSQGTIGGATVAAKIAKARKDKAVKAVVLRVNSPGGSALASEIMWREMELTKQDKPVIVSMGGMAASGGYYISAPADLIIANKTTITGSIGVFGLLLDVSGGMKSKLGLTVDVVKTNPSADLGSLYRRISPHEKEVIMHGIEDVYDTFVGHVSDGRNLTREYVDGIGGGRVWTGVSALEIGLVDVFGGLKDAIALAADRAGVSGDFRVLEMVEAPDNLSIILRSLGMGEASMNDKLGEMFMHYVSIKNMLDNQNTIQARMPYYIEIE